MSAQLSEAAALEDNKALRARVMALEQEIEMMKIEGVAASGTFVCRMQPCCIRLSDLPL